jgi:WbqC-like protein family
MDSINIFSSHYLAPIEYYYHLINNSIVTIDVYENFVKQTYRNRCCILSPNGIQNLTVPLVKARKRKLMKNMKISYDDNWRKMHWKSLEAAYRSSPYFEYYEDDFYPFYHDKQYNFLADFNWDLQQKIIELLNLDVNITLSEKYIESIEPKTDFRNTFSPKIETKLNFNPYIQVFGDRNGFTPNLSIVDILFNEGPNAVNYIKELKPNV